MLYVTGKKYKKDNKCIISFLKNQTSYRKLEKIMEMLVMEL
jgi:hypothetical protein